MSIWSVDVYSYYGLNRTYCDVCEEMRKLIDHGSSLKSNKEVLRSLVEELQVYGNRMEASLADISDLHSLHEKIKDGKKELKDLEREIKKKGKK